MGLLKKKKDLHISGRGGGGGGSQVSPLRPRYVTKPAPCGVECPSGNHIRDWITTIHVRDKLKLSLDEAMQQAFDIACETNPFPSIMGRVCPHPCEDECNRKEKDGAVGINSIERFIGDWALEHDLNLHRLDGAEDQSKKVAVVGAGPSGLSCAYQLARRGYDVTIFESLPHPGGMLRYGIPIYRLPREILDGEIQRILDLGVELKCDTKVGKDVAFDELRKKYAAIYVAIGAHTGKKLGIDGEDGPGILTGTEFLNRVHAGQKVETADQVVVIGGGDTAVDAARVCLRLATDTAQVAKRKGSDVTILYRRTRDEMPAIDREIDEALEEGIEITYLASPKEILRDDDGNVRGMVVQRMELGEPDESGRRRPVPIEGDTYEIPIGMVITAVSQQPALGDLGSEELGDGWLQSDDWGATDVDGVWTGGDNLNLGLATTAIGQGHKAARAIHASLQGETLKAEAEPEPIGPERIKLDWYEPKERQERDVLSPEERLANPQEEVDKGLTQDQALEEATRCFSCGQCFGCENCWMYCQVNAFKQLREPKLGEFYSIDLKPCDGCKKCWEECPCGYIDGV